MKTYETLISRLTQWYSSRPDSLWNSKTTIETVPFISVHCHSLPSDTGTSAATYTTAREFRVPRCTFLTAGLAKFKKNNHTPGVMRSHYLIRVRYVKLSKVSAINHFTLTVKLVQQQFYVTGQILCSSCASYKHLVLVQQMEQGMPCFSFALSPFSQLPQLCQTPEVKSINSKPSPLSTFPWKT